jgi:hypothetical protein
MLQERRARRIRFGLCIHSRQLEWGLTALRPVFAGPSWERYQARRQVIFLRAARRRIGS